MFDFFTAWFRAIADRTNPIAVRDLRRYKGLLLPTLTIVPILLLTCLTASTFTSDSSIFIYETSAVCCMIGGLCGIAFATIYPPVTLLESRIGDESFELAPLSPRVQVHGYLIPGFLIALLFGVLLTPFIVEPPTVSQYAWSYSLVQSPLWTVAVLFFVSQMMSSYLLAFVSRVSSIAEAWTALFFSVFGLLLLFLPPIGTDVLMDTDLTYRGGSLGKFLSWWGIPIICCLIGLTGYILARYHFSRRHESFRRSVIVNLAVLILWCPISMFTVAFLYFLRIVSPAIY